VPCLFLPHPPDPSTESRGGPHGAGGRDRDRGQPPPRPGRYGEQVERRRLGRTGHRSSVAILGGAAFWDGEPEACGAALGSAVDAGVNHLDIAPQYGRAQELLGPFLPRVRDRLFVACKTLRREADGARAQLEDSLRLLGCHHFDLYQLHAVTDRAELDSRAGAVAAILAARDEGLCRWVGITGHELTAPAAHLEALRRYDLDTVMFPLNPALWADAAYRRDAEALLDYARDHDVGVMAIKALAARPWNGRRHTSATWYEPYTSTEEIRRSVDFVLSIPGVQGFCTPGDLAVLPAALDAAAHHRTMTDADQAELAAARASESCIFPMPTPLSAP
jgi:aryl-alcohol dehydrogenase-like predicted oxidoreductase